MTNEANLNRAISLASNFSKIDGSINAAKTTAENDNSFLRGLRVTRAITSSSAVEAVG